MPVPDQTPEDTQPLLLLEDREEPETGWDLKGLFLQALLMVRMTLPTALSYDFSFSLFVLGAMMTNYSSTLDSDDAENTREAAALVTTFLNTVAFLMFSSVLPAVYEIGGALGTLGGPVKIKEEIAAMEAAERFENASEDLESAIVRIQAPPSIEENDRSVMDAVARIPRNMALWGSAWSLAAFGVMMDAKNVLTFLGQNERSAELAQDFLQAYAGFTLTFPARLGIEFMLLNLLDQKRAALMADSSLVAFMGIAYYLGFEKAKGLAGFGLAAGAGVATTFVGFTAYLLKKYNHYFHFIKNWASFSYEDVKNTASLAWKSLPVMGTMVADTSAGFVLNLVAGLTPGVLAVQNYATQYVLLSTVFTASASQVGSMLVAGARGAAKTPEEKPGKYQGTYSAVRDTATSALLATAGVSTLLGLFVSIFPKAYTVMLGGAVTPEVEAELVSVLPITAVGTLLDSLRYTALNGLRAVGDNVIPSVISSLSLWSGIGVAYWLSAVEGWAAKGIAIGYAAGGALGLGSLIALRGREDLSPEVLAKADGFRLIAPEGSPRTFEVVANDSLSSASTPLANGTENNK